MDDKTETLFNSVPPLGNNLNLMWPFEDFSDFTFNISYVQVSESPSMTEEIMSS